MTSHVGSSTMSDNGKPSQDVEGIERSESASVDDASKVTPVVDSKLEKQLVRKLDSVIIPLTCALYLFAFLDRSNLGELPFPIHSCSRLTHKQETPASKDSPKMFLEETQPE